MENCTWIKDESTGDLLYFCLNKKRTHRISAQIFKATSHAGIETQVVVINKLQNRIEKEIGCIECKAKNKE
jgi:hypothetical protein